MNAHCFAEDKSDACKNIIEDSYMDDFLSSRWTAEEAVNIVKNVIRINTVVGFRMQGWAGNVDSVLEEARMSSEHDKDQKTPLCARGGDRVLVFLRYRNRRI